MKSYVSGITMLIGIVVLTLLPGTGFAAGAVVDCSGATPGAFTSISAALATLSPTGPNSITVLPGTCTDNVLIRGFSGLVIQAASTSVTIEPASATRRLLNIFDSHDITIQGPFVFDGGRGVVVNQNSTASLDSITVQNSSAVGFTSLDSLIHLSNSTIQNSTRSGISVTGGTFNLDSGVTVTGNGRSGIAAATGHLVLNGGDPTQGIPANVISHNGAAGVSIADTAEGDFNGDNEITSNAGPFAVLVIHTSTLMMFNGSISSNTGIGVHCGETSHCEFGGPMTIDNNGGDGLDITDHSDAYLDGQVDISGNNGNGVLVDLSSVLNSVGGNTINNNTNNGILLDDISVLKFAAIDTITGNTNFSLECQNNSLVVGDISSLTNTSCGKSFQATAKKK